MTEPTTNPTSSRQRLPLASFDPSGRFFDRFEKSGVRRAQTSTLQINLGRKCNQACLHCHVEAGPNRTEMMEREVAEKILELLDASSSIATVDFTGGAPELSPLFRWFVEEVRKRDLEVIDRCNLTILSEPGQEDLARFLAHHHVRVVASLPCYLEENVEKQRGRDVFQRSIEGIRALNELGYSESLPLDLVYNPTGPSLPPPQASLEADYKRELRDRYGITFSSLLTITNMPIRRFDHALRRDGERERYMELLESNYNVATLPGLMCRSLISVGYDGRVFDCDFNQMLDIPLGGATKHLSELNSFDREGAEIAVADHCFGCTAGAGSSCGGALAEDKTP